MRQLTKHITRLTIASMVGSVFLVSGCATTQMTAEECTHQDWEKVGVVDGTRGRSANYFGRYIVACAQTTHSQVTRQLWEKGRQQGLKTYCTELTAYKIGREGYQWQPVCPLENIEKLEESYRNGRLNYLREQNINDWYYDDYPWGYRYRRGAWEYPRWWW